MKRLPFRGSLSDVLTSRRAVFSVLALCSACGGSVIDGLGDVPWKDAAAASGGSAGGSGSAGSAGKSGGFNTGGAAGEPGTCRAFCCSPENCAPGVACLPFQPGVGTLGACAGDGATGSDGGALPSGCWTAETECNPLTNEGCSPGNSCDYAEDDSGYKFVVACFGGDNVMGPGDPCDNVNGPFCKPTLHCAP